MKYRIAAIFLSLTMLALVIIQLVDLPLFPFGTPSSSPDPIAAVADWLWSYRTVDVLIQGVLLLAAVMGASAMFRTRRPKEVK
ncbi:hypothetical protein EU524_00755 [Candidatus Thorarchaeota archaeon]|nr:MAG: hypothetical protein EU524_00755 [Candidatus Thorarchaeota archaeon]